MRVGKTVKNTFKGCETEKRGGETKILKRGQAGSRGRCHKKEGCWNLLINYDFYFNFTPFDHTGR